MRRLLGIEFYSGSSPIFFCARIHYKLELDNDNELNLLCINQGSEHKFNVLVSRSCALTSICTYVCRYTYATGYCSYLVVSIFYRVTRYYHCSKTCMTPLNTMSKDLKTPPLSQLSQQRYSAVPSPHLEALGFRYPSSRTASCPRPICAEAYTASR